MVFRPYLPTINVKTLFCKISFLIFWNNILTFSSIVAFAFVIVQFSRCRIREIIPLMVGLRGLEPPTSRLSGVRSNHLSYKPMFLIRSCESLKRIGIRFFLKPLVEICGIEPQTPCLQSRCSPS